MKLEKKLFHSIHSYAANNLFQYTRREQQLDEILYKFELIFKSGYILAYNDIKKNGSNVSRNKYINLNGDDMISLSLHYKNPEELDYKLKNDLVDDVEDAFQDFILQEPSIVLSENIRTKLKSYKYPGMYLERLFMEPISLKYMEAISVYGLGMLEPFFYQINEQDFKKYVDCVSPRVLYIEFLDKLKILLNQYGYNIPIVDIISGNVFKENEEYRKVLTDNRRY